MLFEFHKSSNSTNIMKNIYALYPGGETGYVCSSNDLANSKWLTVIFLISSILECRPLWIMIYWSRSSTRKLSKSSKYYVQLYKISLSIFLPKYQVQHSIIYKSLLTRNEYFHFNYWIVTVDEKWLLHLNNKCKQDSFSSSIKLFPKLKPDPHL